MDQEKLVNILKDKTFTEKTVKLQTPEEVQAAFKEKGIEISIKDVQTLGSLINKLIEKGKTELSEDELNEVAGGTFRIYLGDPTAIVAGALAYGATIVSLGIGAGYALQWALKER